MTAPTDRVQLLKRESTALGGQDSDEQAWPTPINPQQDGIEVLGVFFQDATHRDELVYIARVGDDMVFRDPSNPTEHTLTDLLATSGVSPTAEGQVYLSVDGATFGAYLPLSHPDVGVLINEDGILVVSG